jgi:adenylate cyclase
VITQFQGDAMLISFNTARPDPDHAANAVRTAIGIQQIVAQTRFGPGIVMPTRCGINTGELISGAVGTRERLLFTVFGDEVNIAARLEQLNKEYGTYILATEQTVAAAGSEFASRPIGIVTVRGRTTPVNVYTIEVPDSGIAPES